MRIGLPKIRNPLKGEPVLLTREWQLYSENPIISSGGTGQWDELYASWGSVVRVSRTEWRLYYSGKDTRGKLRIGLACSEDGFCWRKYQSNPILSYGSSGNWDEGGVYCPVVWKDLAEWKMIFTGLESNHHYQIGIAQSDDGINWFKSQHNPVFCSSERSNVNVYGKPEAEGWGLFFDETGYYLLYNSVTKKPREVYVAFSKDLISWKSVSSTPLLASEGSFLQLGYMKYCACPYKFGEHILVFSAVSDRRYKKSAIGLWEIKSLLNPREKEFLGYVAKQKHSWCEKEFDTPFPINDPANGQIRCYFGGRSRYKKWAEGVVSIPYSTFEAQLNCNQVR